MRKILVILPFLLLSLMSWSQLRTNLSIGGQINTSSAFLDASSTITWNSSDNIGKGLIFPSADLTRFTISASGLTGIGSNYPSRFDGMIIYNTVAGTVSVKDGAETITVTPGFYFYSNKTTSLSGGTWLHMNDNQSTSIPSGASLPATAGHVAGDLYYVTGTGLYVFDGTAWTASGSVLADGSVTSAKIADDSILAEDIATGAVTTTEILNGTIKGEDIGAGQITTTEILNGTIQNEDIADGQISLAKLATDATNKSTAFTLDEYGVPKLKPLSEFGGSATIANGVNPITRSGLGGLTGATIGTTDLATFINKVFFPSLSPRITSFKYSGNAATSTQTENATTKDLTNVPASFTMSYASTPSGNIDFPYVVVQRGDTPPAITKVELLKGSTAFSPAVESTSLTGTLTVPVASVHSGTSTESVTLNLKVTDADNNTVTLPLTINFSAALGVTIASAKITTDGTNELVPPNPIEGDGSSGDPYLIDRSSVANYTLNWSYTLGDNASVTGVSFTGNPALSEIASGTSLSLPLFTLPNQNYYVGIRAKGNVTTSYPSTYVNTKYYQLRDKIYWGFLSTSSAPTDEGQITGLGNSMLKTTYIYSSSATLPATPSTSNSIVIANTNVADRYFAWAVPTYGQLLNVSLYTFGAAWTTVSVNTYDVTVSGKPYKVFVLQAGTSQGVSVKAALKYN